MSDTDHPDVSGLLLGELRTAEVVAAAAHLDQCPACRHELVDMAAGHALLRTTARTLGPEQTDLPAAPQVPRGPVVLDRLPFPGPPARTARLLLAVAAAVLVAGAGVALGSRLAPDAPAATVADAGPPADAPQQTAVLRPVTTEGTGGMRATGAMTMSTEDTAAAGSVTWLAVDAQHLPRTADGDFYYVWLMDPSTQKLLPLGQLDPAGTSTFELPSRLVGRYTSLDVSLEQDDGEPAHSNTSVLRATYATRQG